jgi:hypothetical protein
VLGQVRALLRQAPLRTAQTKVPQVQARVQVLVRVQLRTGLVLG